MSRSFLLVQVDGNFRHLIIDAADAPSNVKAGETLVEAPEGSQPVPGRQIYVDGDLQEN